MSGSRRGFIGIFAQKDDVPHEDEVEELRPLENLNPKENERQFPQPETVERSAGVGEESNAESDWDDIFGDGPKKQKAAPVKESGNPGTKSESQVPAETQPVTDVKSSDRTEDTIKTKSDQLAADSTQNTPTKKSMHQGPSPKSILSASDRQAITDAMQTLREKLSFTRQVTAEQRNGLMKLGETGRSFIGQALKVVNENPDVLPRSFDDERFSADVDLAETLKSVAEDLNELSERVADTQSKISSSAFIGALTIHNCGKFDGDSPQGDAYRRKTKSNANADNSAAMNGVGV